MNMFGLVQFDLVYLATPYTKYPDGIETAFRDACRLAARLLRLGVKVYSPIAHTHPLAIYGELDPLDLNIWLPFDAAMMDKADAIIVAMLRGWESSTGIRHEIQAFIAAGKQVYFLDPDDLSFEPASAEEREQFRSAVTIDKSVHWSGGCNV